MLCCRDAPNTAWHTYSLTHIQHETHTAWNTYSMKHLQHETHTACLAYLQFDTPAAWHTYSLTHLQHETHTAWNTYSFFWHICSLTHLQLDTPTAWHTCSMKHIPTAFLAFLQCDPPTAWHTYSLTHLQLDAPTAWHACSLTRLQLDTSAAWHFSCLIHLHVDTPAVLCTCSCLALVLHTYRIETPLLQKPFNMLVKLSEQNLLIIFLHQMCKWGTCTVRDRFDTLSLVQLPPLSDHQYPNRWVIRPAQAGRSYTSYARVRQSDLEVSISVYFNPKPQRSKGQSQSSEPTVVNSNVKELRC